VHLELFQELKEGLAFYLDQIRHYDKKNGHNQYTFGDIKDKLDEVDLLFKNIDSNVSTDQDTLLILSKNHDFIDIDKPKRPGNLDLDTFFNGDYLNQFLFKIPYKINLSFKNNPHYLLINLENICYVELVNLQRVFNLFSYYQNDTALKSLQFLHNNLVSSIHKKLSQYGKVHLKNKFNDNPRAVVSDGLINRNRFKERVEITKLEDICKPGAYDSIISILISANYISQIDKTFIKIGNKRKFISILKGFEQKSYYRKGSRILNEDYMKIALESFRIKIGIDTAKKATGNESTVITIPFFNL
jgi:hypothetical protein